jgi:hypothetical protein
LDTDVDPFAELRRGVKGLHRKADIVDPLLAGRVDDIAPPLDQDVRPVGARAWRFPNSRFRHACRNSL